MTVVWLFVAVALILFPVMGAAWLTQRATVNAGWGDVFWTFGTGIGGGVCALAPLGAPLSARQVLVGVIALAWSFRLGLYIAIRVGSSPQEDVRYARFRREWGGDFQRRMFGFLIVQAPIAAVLALGIMVAARNPAPGLGVADLLGVAILALSVGGETLADRQMRVFRAAKAGPVCDRGLWALSRHPNYFFEFVGWFAYPVIALFAGGFSNWPWGWLALPGPALMYWLLVYVSGIPPLERAMLDSRGEAYAAYQARVPAFFPGFGASASPSGPSVGGPR